MFLSLSPSPKIPPIRGVHPLTPEQRQKALADGRDVASLENAGVVHFEKVSLGRDYGTTIEVVDGLKEGEYVVVDPGDSVKDGALVQIAPSSDARNSGGERK